MVNRLQQKQKFKFNAQVSLFCLMSVFLFSHFSIAKEASRNETDPEYRDGLRQRLDLPSGCPEQFEVSVMRDQQERTLVLTCHSLTAPDFRVLVYNNGLMRELERPETKTYRGYIAEEPDVKVAATLGTDGLSATVFEEDGFAWKIKPPERRSGDAFKMMQEQSADHVIMDLVDEIDPHGGCGIDIMPPDDESIIPQSGSHSLTHHAAAKRVATSVEQMELSTTTSGGCLYQAEISFDCDYEYYTQFGQSDPNYTVELVHQILNEVDLMYARDVQITYLLREVVVRETPFYDHPTADGTLLGMFKNEWNAGQASGIYQPIDLAHLMTAKGWSGSIAGLAWVGTVCGGNKYAWSRHSVGVVGHEIAHNWGGPHYCDQEFGCSSLCGACLVISPYIRQVIMNNRDGWAGCLDVVDGYATPLPPYVVNKNVSINLNETSPGSIVTIDVLEGATDGNCDTLVLDVIDNPSLLGAAVTVSPGTSPDGYDEILYTVPMVTGEDVIYFTVGDGTGEQVSRTLYINLVVPELVAHYKMDEINGGTMVDATGRYHGSYINDPNLNQIDVPDPYILEPGARSVYFDGSTRAQTPDVPALKTDQFTVSFWAKGDPAGGHEGVISSRDSGGYAAYFLNGYLHVQVVDLDNGGWKDVDSPVIQADTWHHFAFTYDQTTLRLYMDGVEVDTEVVRFATTSSEIWIGHDRTNLPFTGHVDDIRLYNYALPDAEIQLLTEPDSGQINKAVSHYKMNESSGRILTDAMGRISGVYWNNPGLAQGDVADVFTESDEKSVAFSGGADYAAIPTIPEFQANCFSVAFWMKGDLVTNTTPIMSSGNSTAGYQFVPDAGRIQFRLSDGAGWTSLSSRVLSADRWYHVAATYDGLVVRLYVDGIEAAADMSAYRPEAVEPILIAGDGVNPGLNGWIDDLWFYNYAISQEQIRGLGANIGKAELVSPANSESNVSETVVLEWSDAAGADRHRVYLGTDAVAVANATVDSPEYLGQITETSYSPSELIGGQEYFWRIDEVAGGAVTTGSIWGFSVQPLSGLNYIAHYQFGEDDPSSAADIGGNVTTMDSIGGMDLTRSGNPVYKSGVPAGIGSVLSMKFYGDSYYQGGTGVITQTDNVGLEFWMKLSLSASGQHSVWNCGDSNFEILLNPSNEFYLHNPGNWVVGPFGSATPGTWHHIALVRDSGNTTFYLDGVPQGSQNTVLTGEFNVGRYIAGGGANLEGNIDEMRVFTFEPGGFDSTFLSGTVENNGSGDPLLDAPAVVNFGNLANDDSNDVSIIISNTGSTNTLMLTAEIESGTETYSIVSQPTSISPGMTDSIVIRFEPDGLTGALDGVLKISSNDAARPVYRIGLKGTAYASGDGIQTIAHYRFGEDDLGAALNVTGNMTTVDAVGSSDLIRHGEPVYKSSTPFVGSMLSMKFLGSGDYYTGGSGVITQTDNVGLSFWMKLSASASGQHSVWNCGDANYEILLNASNQFHLHNPGNWIVGPFGSATPGVWHHVALVRDSGSTTFYLDGVAKGSRDIALTGEFNVGRYIAAGGEDFEGNMDEMYVFTFAPGTFDLANLPGLTGEPGVFVEGMPVVAEGGVGGLSEADTISVRLGAAPAHSVTVTVSDADNPDAVSLSPSQLTFGPSDYATAKTVTVTAINDVQVSAVSGLTSLTFDVSSTDPSYDAMNVPELSVLVLEDECVPSNTVAADVNQDCRVDLQDLVGVAILFLDENPGCTVSTAIAEDINNNCDVNMDDIAELAEKWQSCWFPNTIDCQ